jgi:nicotinamide-nucleotide amidase
MNAELIAVGTELLLGEIANTDGQFISRCLSELGINLYYHTVVGDNPARLASVLKQAAGRSDLVITTGGLGPTYDDLTKEVIAETMGKKLILHEPSFRRLKEHMEKFGRTMTKNNEKQAWLPEGCIVLDNDWGTAPGAIVEVEGCTVIMLPGPPRECEPMMLYRVMPYLQEREKGVILSQTVRIFGMGESAVENRLNELMKSATNPTVAPYAKAGEVLIRVTARAETKEEAEKLIAPMLDRLHQELGHVIYGTDVASMEKALVEALAQKGMTLATAESCTGGLVSQKITNVPGASAVFYGGVVSYADGVKEDVLSVPLKVLAKHGAVSEPVAAYMARGVCRITGSDIGIGITGIAGPSGGSEEKPVGLVYVGLCVKGAVMVRKLNLGGIGRDRDMIRHLAALNAMHMVLEYCRK